MTFNFKSFLLIPMFFICLIVNAQQTFNQAFNPVKPFITDIEKTHREDFYLNGDWKFQPVYSKKPNEFKRPNRFNWEETPLKIPSAWNVNGFTKANGGDFVAYPSYPEQWEKAKMGWMQKTFVTPKSFNSKRVILHFEAVAGKAEIYLNGKLIAKNYEVFLPFEIDVTDHLKPNQANELIVGVAQGQLFDDRGKYGRRTYVAGSFWGKHIAGIWQDVYLYAVPETYIDDIFVQPNVSKNELAFELTIKNKSKKSKTITVSSDIYDWVNLSGNTILDAPVENWKLGDKALNQKDNKKITIKANSTIKHRVSIPISAGQLKFWDTENPNLYGAVISLLSRGKTIDSKYERFGWREFKIKGDEFFLNGKKIVLNGDSWHFMGIPQMTRRYAWGWYKMLKDANANAVRLHAQPFPEFYLDVADEMGICVLDETAIWASDGGPKIDSEKYWASCVEHVEKLLLRDKNHASVFGWSVCNETIPVAANVFKAPKELVERQVHEINRWAEITAKYDPTRDWISGDGEHHELLKLPTIIDHYGGEPRIKEFSSKGIPWGMGETGMAYYGTPKQIAGVNGDRAYESQLGRMEGVALEAFRLLNLQKKYDASYLSIFNVVWYGLKPLELGMKDTSKTITDKDGIFFTQYKQNAPGVQPERLGPYTTTLNPGYDKNLPLYQTWPLFDAVKAAYSNEDFSVDIPTKEEPTYTPNKFTNTVYFGGNTLKSQLKEVGIDFTTNLSGSSLIVVDGAAVKFSKKDINAIEKAKKKGAQIFVWGVAPKNEAEINKILSSDVKVTDRKSTSYIRKADDIILMDLFNENLYFSELQKKGVSKFGLTGDFVNESTVLLEACIADWNRWNYNGENYKTGGVIRSERETKEPGTVLAVYSKGKSKEYVASLNPFDLTNGGETLALKWLMNMGVKLSRKSLQEKEALNTNYEIAQVLALGSFRQDGKGLKEVTAIDFLDGETTIKPANGMVTKNKFWQLISSGEKSIFDFRKQNLGSTSNAAAYLSFWVYSPRSLVDLLAEPNMPQMSMLMGSDDGYKIFLNGKTLMSKNTSGGLVKDQWKIDHVPLDKGWNHFLVKVTNGGGGWQFQGRFESNNKDFMKQLKSAVEQ